MTYVLTLSDFTPPARADDISYVEVAIEESSEEDGTFTVIDTLLTGPDEDTEHPESRDLTTTNATIAEGGFYRVTWIDGNGVHSTPSEVVQNANQLAGGLRPSVGEVASKVRARTKVRGGNEVGTFNTQTRPTADEVDDLIDEAVDEVMGKVKAPDSESSPGYERRIRGAVALYTAILVELSFFPEAVGSGKSPEPEFRALYESRIKALAAEGEAGEVTGGGGEEGGVVPPAAASWTFPDGVGIGFGTRW